MGCIAFHRIVKDESDGTKYMGLESGQTNRKTLFVWTVVSLCPFTNTKNFICQTITLSADRSTRYVILRTQRFGHYLPKQKIFAIDK